MEEKNNELLDGVTTAEKKSRELSAEDRAKVLDAINYLKETGVSKEFASIMDAVVDWNSDSEEIRLANRKTLTTNFPGLREYVKSDEYKSELNRLLGLSKLSVIMRVITNYYGREIIRKKTVKVVVSINNELYEVPKSLLDSIPQNMTKDERKQFILQSEHSKKLNKEIEEF
jgi:hypothetical protein